VLASGDVERLADAVVARSSLRGARRARLAADLREHLEEEVLAGHSAEAIAAAFGDPALVAALADRSPPQHRASLRHLRPLAAACALAIVTLYGASAARLGTFEPEPDVAFGVAAPLAAKVPAAASLPAPELRAWFLRTARGAGGDADSLARALRIARAMKGVHTRSLGARLLEPLYFAGASSVEDVWPAVRSAAIGPVGACDAEGSSIRAAQIRRAFDVVAGPGCAR